MADPQSAMGNPKPILIVDDDDDDIEITRRVLIKAGCGSAILSVNNGESALLFLQEARDLPSLILIDLKMEGMNGIDTLRRIRADGRLQRIPAVIVSNSTIESDRTAALTAGADGFLHKAFDLDEYARDLSAVLERWIQG